MKHIIIGGVAGGATAAARIRRNDESAQIILLEKGEHISYANCGLPYYIGNVIENRQKLLLQTPKSFGQRFNIEVRVQNEAFAIDTKNKIVRIRNEYGAEYNEHFDKLLLSPGATPFVPPIKGIDSEGIFTLRNVNDTDNIKNYINSRRVTKAIVLGGGFIGLEMVENLHNLGIEVTIVEKFNQVKHALDFSMAVILHEHLRNKGVHLYLENEIVSFVGKNGRMEAHLKNGTMLDTDMVILSIGVRPLTQLAESAGIKLGETKGIWVDEYLQTSAENIYAVGDAVEFPHPLTGKPWLNYMANPANRQAVIAADNMVFGNSAKYEGAIGTAIAKVFDLTAAATGLNAKRLTDMKIPFKSVYIHAPAHADYYPGAMPLSIKLTFDPATGKLFGGQFVGAQGVDKRVDQVSLAIKNNGTIYNLMQLEQAYAPPYSSAKDPLAMAGYVARNIISGKMPVVYWRQMLQADPDEIFILDVRTKEEFLQGSIAGATLIPIDEIRSKLNEIPRNKIIYIYCHSGRRGYLAQQILQQNGFKGVYNLSGGYETYKRTTQLYHKC